MLSFWTCVNYKKRKRTEQNKWLAPEKRKSYFNGMPVVFLPPTPPKKNKTKNFMGDNSVAKQNWPTCRFTTLFLCHGVGGSEARGDFTLQHSRKLAVDPHTYTRVLVVLSRGGRYTGFVIITSIAVIKYRSRETILK